MTDQQILHKDMTSVKPVAEMGQAVHKLLEHIVGEFQIVRIITNKQTQEWYMYVCV